MYPKMKAKRTEIKVGDIVRLNRQFKYYDPVKVGDVGVVTYVTDDFLVYKVRFFKGDHFPIYFNFIELIEDV